jgi:hypothetical protein
MSGSAIRQEGRQSDSQRSGGRLCPRLREASSKRWCRQASKQLSKVGTSYRRWQTLCCGPFWEESSCRLDTVSCKRHVIESLGPSTEQMANLTSTTIMMTLLVGHTLCVCGSTRAYGEGTPSEQCTIQCLRPKSSCRQCQQSCSWSCKGCTHPLQSPGLGTTSSSMPVSAVRREV